MASVTAKVADTWVRPVRPMPQARLRLYCLPFAGGGMAAFQPWGAALGPGIEVCPVRLPGREARFKETCYRSLGPLADDLADVIDFECRRPAARPFAIFGHSMGAVIGFEVMHRLSDRARARAVHLIVSGRYSPPEPARETPIAHLPDDEFLRVMNERYDAIPQLVLDTPELLAMVLRPLKADLQLIETYRYESRPPLEVPITAFGGREDFGVPRESLDAWGAMTRGPSKSLVFDGGHFFIHTHAPAVLQALRAVLVK